MSKVRTYRVGYWIEQGYVLTVQARSQLHAERIVRCQLDIETDRLEDSERVHHADGIAGVTLVPSKRGAP